MDRRKYDRITARIPVRIRHRQGTTVTHTLDVSGTGIRIDAPGRLEIQDPAIVDLFLPGSNFWITIAATVKWRTPSGAGIELSHDPWSREWMGRLLGRV